MAKVPLPIANGFYKSDSLPISAQECLNFYPSIVQAPALNQEVLFGVPGIRQLATSGDIDEVNRGAHTKQSRPYFVNGGFLYELSEFYIDGVFKHELSKKGEIEGTGFVSMADNGHQLMILVPGGKGYIYSTEPDVLTEITDPDFTANGAPQHVVFIDGYFVVTTDSKKFIVSALNDGLSYNALDFGTAEADPDDIVAPIVFRNQLFIGGSETLEAFQNIGGADFPFQRTGLFIDKGILAPFSITKSDTSFVFLGGAENEGPAIWSLSGNDVAKISTTAIDSMLNLYTRAQLRAVFSWSYAQKGAYFVGFNLEDTTIVYDTTSGRWHERKSLIYDGDNTVLSRCRINSITSVFGKVVVGDMQDGRIGFLNPELYKEYDQLILRRISTQPFSNNMDSFAVASIELTIESGVGNEEVKNPQITMDRSLDGKTYKDLRIRKMGKIGEFKKRCIWRRNGRSSRFETFRFTLTDPVKPVIILMTADIII